MERGFQMKKKGVSGIIVAVIMIALVMAVGVVVWVVVQNVVKGTLGGVKSCLDTVGKATVDGQYTCYDPDPDGNPATDDDFFQFAVSIGGISPDKVVVSITGPEKSVGYEIPAVASAYPKVKRFGDLTFGLALPALTPNSGQTYVTEDFTTMPGSVSVALVMDGQQCESSDILSEIDEC